MAMIEKAERDEAQINLAMTVRILDGLTEENLLVLLMGRAETQWGEALDKHVTFCTKLGEDPSEGAHEEWASAITKLFYECYYEVEKKLEAIRVANESRKQGSFLPILLTCLGMNHGPEHHY